MKKVLFLTLAEVIEIHNDRIQRYGGHTGIRDMNLLSPAVAMPYASFSGTFLHVPLEFYNYYTLRSLPQGSSF